jgi:ferritin-like protein
MAQGSTTLHEDPEKLKPETIEQHRAWVSLMEEFEAADWYNQRVDACGDKELAGILAHNRDEEKEHAAMVLEWLRRHDPKLDEHLHTYLFTEGSVLDIEKAAEGGGGEGGSDESDDEGSLGIGSLHGTGSLVVTGA